MSNSLDSRAFSVFEGRNKREIKYFVAEDEPLTIGFLLDRSGSMRSPRSSGSDEIPTAVDGIRSFIGRGNPGNRYFIISFANDADLLLDTTSERKSIDSALDDFSNAKPKGNTGVFAALDFALEKMSKIVDGKKALIVVSDGIDNSSTEKDYERVRNAVGEFGVLIFLVNYVRPDETQTAEMIGRVGRLEPLIENTGGHVVYPNSKATDKFAFEKLADELRNQYTLRFGLTEPEQRKWHKIKVSLDKSERSAKFTLIAPNGYFY